LKVIKFNANLLWQLQGSATVCTFKSMARDIHDQWISKFRKIIARRGLLGTFTMKAHFLLPAVFLLCSCKNNEQHKKGLNAQNHSTVILEAAYELGERKDSSAIKLLLTNILDPRISTNVRFKGMTVCYGRLVALKKITGTMPAWKISQFSLDTPAVAFYHRWALSKGIITNKNEIDLKYHP
jgi:hypothetical protein